MMIAKVVGHVVSTQKDVNFVGTKLLILNPMERKGTFSDEVKLAVDAVGAGIGETVMIVTGTAARMVVGKDVPVDLAIVGILDSIEIE